ncbi:MAG: C40 family peptidase [Hahellaceae bacterium]|nr:C40 family peptidase [Hahellaceae bacterium]
MKSNSLLSIVFCLNLVGCGSLPQQVQTHPVEPDNSSGKANESVSSGIIRTLYAQYDKWKGVKHVDGGLDQSGIDCSGFVYVTFKERFYKTLPRSTELLAEHGRAIALQQARPGDLLFFKTGLKKRHVGIYMGDQKFVHVSSSRGVMISELQNPYWEDAYWQARRVL